MSSIGPPSPGIAAAGGGLLSAVGQALRETSGPLVLVVLDGDLRCVTVSAGAVEISGVPAADHVGRRWSDVWPSVAVAMPAARRAMRDDRPVVPPDLLVERNTTPGGRRWWRVQWLPLHEDGAVVGVAALLWDVTAPRRVPVTDGGARRRAGIMQAHASRLAAAIAPAEVAQVTAAAIVKVFRPDTWAVGLVERDAVMVLSGRRAVAGSRWRRTSPDDRSPLHDAVRTGRRVERDTGAMAAPVGDGWGAISLDVPQHPHRRRSDDADQALFAALADQCRQALDRIRRQQLAEQRWKRAETTRDMASILAATTTSEEMAAVIANRAHSAIGAQYAQLGLLDAERDVLSLYHGEALGPTARQDWGDVPLATPIPVTDVVRTGQSMVFATRNTLVEAYPLVAKAADESGYQTVAVVPIIFPKGSTAGTLAMAWSAPHSADEETLAAMQLLAHACAAVLLRGDRARAQARDHARTKLVARVLSELEAATTAEARVQRLLELLVPKVADYATVEEPGSSRPVWAVAHREPELVAVLRSLRERHAIPRDCAYSVARAAAGQTQLISRITPEVISEYALEPAATALLQRLAPRSYVALPLVVGDSITPSLVLSLGISDPERRAYSVDDVAFLQELSARAGRIVSAALLLDDERATAVRLQKALLPDAVVQHPELAVAARYQPADTRLQVGGDWYETVPLPDGRIAVGVGDVVGHGLEAAAAMGQLRTAFAALARRSASPAVLLDELESFAAAIAAAKYASVACAFLDLRRQQVIYSSAGHPPMLLLDPSGTGSYLQGGRSWLLASHAGRRRRNAVRALPPGSTLLLYSDGLIERRREALDEGLERLLRAAEDRIGQPVELLCDDLIATLLESQPKRDDLVLVALRVLPEARTSVSASTSAPMSS